MADVPATMRGMLLTGHGDVDKLEYRDDLPVPSPGPGDVLVRVEAAGVNNTDINTRIAWYSKGDGLADDASWSGQALQFPRIQGADVCGVIVAVGAGVDLSRVGQRVIIEPCIRESGGEALATPWYFGSECHGGFAEYTRVASRHAYHVDSTLSAVELASFPCSYSTAENMLTRAQVSTSDRVLVTGASGGVGSAAVQLAKARGATVIAICGQEKRPGLLKLGADEVISRTESVASLLGSDSVDVVLDLVGGDKWPELMDVLKPGGRYAVSGAIAGADVALDLRTLYLKDLCFFGCTVLEPEVFGRLVELVEKDAISPAVAAVYPLSEMVAAQTAFLKKDHVGKIVLDIVSQF